MNGAPENDAAAARRERWWAVRRLLAVRTDGLGDLLMTTPALAALRCRLPEAHVTLLTSAAGARAARHVPVDAAWTCAPPWVPPAAGTEPGDGPLMRAALGRPGQAEAELVERIAEGAFDAAVIFTVCTQSALPAALLCRMAGVPLRLAHARENPYALLTDWMPDEDRPAARMRREVQRQLDLVAAIGAVGRSDRLRFAIDTRDRQGVRVRLAAAGLAPRQDAPDGFVLVHPGAHAASRRWPAASFGRVAAALTRAGWPVVLVGGSTDLGLVQEARSAMLADGAAPAATLAGSLTLGELAALIEAAGVLVANNSAPTHLAAAVGTPVVDLYALTNPQHTPWRVPHRVLSHDVPCRWCLKSTCPEGHHRCLRGVHEGDVVAATLSLLGEASGAVAPGARNVPIAPATAPATAGGPTPHPAPQAEAPAAGS